VPETLAEPTLIASRTSSTDTLAKAGSGPKSKPGKKPNLRNFGEKNRVLKTVLKEPIPQFFYFAFAIVKLWNRFLLDIQKKWLLLRKL
jgi:hypothetical protein